MNNESNHQQGGEPNRKLTALNAVQKAADTLKRRYSDEIPNASISFIPGTPEALRAHRNKKKQKKKADRHARTKVAFLRYYYYDIAFQYFVEQVLDADSLSLPAPTRHPRDPGVHHRNDVLPLRSHLLSARLQNLQAGPPHGHAVLENPFFLTHPGYSYTGCTR